MDVDPQTAPTSTTVYVRVTSKWLVSTGTPGHLLDTTLKTSLFLYQLTGKHRVRRPIKYWSDSAAPDQEKIYKMASRGKNQRPKFSFAGKHYIRQSCHRKVRRNETLVND
jgi:hypothetical protein